VLVDGRAVNACLLFTVTVEGKSITTAAGLAAPDGTLHPLQVALLEAGAVQCGFCTPGILMVAAELLAGKTTPSEEDVRWALAANLCRCTGYVKIIEGILAATAAEEAGDG
jgi:carbon-monoxide dehydrogenase small subunit